MPEENECVLNIPTCVKEVSLLANPLLVQPIQADHVLIEDNNNTIV